MTGTAAKRIVVTGVGANPGFDLTRSLQRLGHHVIATDADPLAPGLLLPDVTARLTPRADDPRYTAAVLDLCGSTRADALMVGIENDLPPLLRIQRSLTRAGVRTWLPKPDSVQTCLDKAAFHDVLTAAGIPTPRSWLPDQLDQVPDDISLVVKPRTGHGAQNVYFCRTRGQARVLCELVPAALIQEKITGSEFTADCLVDRGARASAILRHRTRVKAGLATVSTTFHDGQVADRVKQTLSAVGAAGLCCVQGFITDGPQRVLITEVNVRVAGGFALTEAAGADLIGQTINGLFHQSVQHDLLAYRPDVFLTKYTETLASGEAATLRALKESQ
ncbi:carbamoyl-phosphate synthase large subunit [Kitasatospora sp. MAP12-15]|uniref:ATP-grasp domain-containing protein n=1 Tax=unclassified Kitasatospora TaxID=2633591 RepID=UPI00247494EA|nr:ATP-grasp domain-containing protein [Kitasatospora sp. MAP12-44]MDH6113697.1 carbamoyl-phosphate synthase large subunit [Kitasatospora sp. MAP12-44]